MGMDFLCLNSFESITCNWLVNVKNLMDNHSLQRKRETFARMHLLTSDSSLHDR